MPIYEYTCSACGHKFELMRSFSQSGEPATCPKCKKKAKRILSTFACCSTGEGGVPTAIPGGGGGCSSCGGGSCSGCGV